jgi:hypothetical protein
LELLVLLISSTLVENLEKVSCACQWSFHFFDVFDHEKRSAPDDETTRSRALQCLDPNPGSISYARSTKTGQFLKGRTYHQQSTWKMPPTEIGGNDVVLSNGLGAVADSFGEKQEEVEMLGGEDGKRANGPPTGDQRLLHCLQEDFWGWIKWGKSLGISGSVCVFAHTNLTTLFHLVLSSLYKEKMVCSS